jgi:hypothetical protein
MSQYVHYIGILHAVPPVYCLMAAMPVSTTVLSRGLRVKFAYCIAPVHRCLKNG